jgi:hypothetical protein
MGLFDLIRELRTCPPDTQKTAKTMTYFGWGCLAGGLWNFLIPQIDTFKHSKLPIPPSYPYFALVGLSVAGALFLFAARGIRDMEPWGKRVGQAAVLLLVAQIILFPLVIMPEFLNHSPASASFSLFTSIIMLIALCQFVLPGYYGIKYLNRLPANDVQITAASYNQEQVTRDLAQRMSDRAATAGATKFHDSPFPFGLSVTFPLLIGSFLLIGFLADKLFGQAAFAVVFPGLFLFLFIGPAIFNYLPSPFQAGKPLIASFTGGGSIYLFSGSVPFFRLMVYDNALEVRVMFNRYLVPYDKMEDPPEKIGFFTSGLLIKSDLPGVPSNIRFAGFGMKNILQTVNQARDEFLKKEPTK